MIDLDIWKNRYLEAKIQFRYKIDPVFHPLQGTSVSYKGLCIYIPEVPQQNNPHQEKVSSTQASLPPGPP